MAQAPYLGCHFPPRLVGFRGLRSGRAFDLNAVAFLDSADLCVHQAGNAVFTRQDSKVRTHRAASADHALEPLEDRRGQRAAAVVNDCNGFVGNAVGEKLEHAITRPDVARGPNKVLRVLDHVVADAALLTAIDVLRCEHRLGMLEAEILEVLAEPCRGLVGVRPFANGDHRRPVEPMTCGQKLLLDRRELLGADELIGLVENKTGPVAAEFVETAAHEFLDGAVVGVDDRGRALIAVFVIVDVKFGHDFLPGRCGHTLERHSRASRQPASWTQVWWQAKVKSTDIRTFLSYNPRRSSRLPGRRNAPPAPASAPCRRCFSAGCRQYANASAA